MLSIVMAYLSHETWHAEGILVVGDLPLTFEARGATAHFGNRALKLARLKMGWTGPVKSLEVLIPGAGGGVGRLVVPFDKLAEYNQLDARDTALLQEIAKAAALKAPEPMQLRRIRIEVDEKHGLTDAIRAEAAQEIKADKMDRFQVRLSFIAQLTRECGVRLGDRFMASANTERLIELIHEKQLADARIDVNELTRRVVEITGQAVNISPDEIEQRLEQLAELLTPFGKAGQPYASRKDGFLSRARHELAKLLRDLAAARSTIRPEAVEAVDKALPNVKQALDFVDGKLAAVDAQLKDLSRALMEWQTTVMLVHESRRCVAGGLDGWRQMAEAFDEGATMVRQIGDSEPIERNIAWIEQNIPVIPLREIDPEAGLMSMDDGAMAMNQQVKEIHGWKTGELDRVMAQRLGVKR
jgi:hypothetical protein